MSVLSLDNVTLRYAASDNRAAPVLASINLKVARDEFVVVIGRSGSGKTSLLNLAAGFLAASSGRVCVDGRSVAGPDADRAVVFQDDALYPWLTAVDNVAFPLQLRGVAKSERLDRARILLDRVGLPGAANRNVWELSGGMRQRVGIARALASDPKFLLMDEPLGALDALTRSRMQSFLLDVWQKSNVGALLITHSIEEALLLATRIIVLAPNPGRIASEITTTFGRDLLAGVPLAELRSSSSFRGLHDELTAIIHAEDEGIAA
ncbi:ABC transporter ATP-binding protein [Ensifer adhaerens]|uniref:taurine ABC transporter ATP-binding protein n=1 Tax=Ensifer adhaerens TaxID=106592 RepID=UPI001CBAFBE5|nr:ABC transporter ATP-binding protein [Ensifer adhaerens]MBZ7925535.1 ABC transporter ATP-binding protein [Ensifer adhaerens]UAX95308.1 ABC transporter ATP-binding protein [Ensifer adhaerens]UAY02800.1 ABC transporter ATP-binding protein [Ensifer adhaerens]UAY10784.1 ABC transporter ATP-binding protein [Ensifer adhaerens]